MGILIGHYGMGWVSQNIGASSIISHSGTVPDFGAFMALVPEQKKGLVLLFNANHGMMKITLDEVGMEAAQLLAGERPTRTIFGALHWGMRGLLLIPDLLIALTLVPVMSKMRGWVRLFMPDFSWIAWICGSFAVIWIFLRTGLMLKALRKYSASSTRKEDTNP